MFINSSIGMIGPPGPPGPPGSLVVPTVLVSNNYTALVSDYFIGVNTANSSITVTLPISIDGTTYIVKDYAGNASTNPITLTASTSIDNNSTATINTNFGSITLVSTSAGWSIV